MKKFFVFACVAALFAFVSCNKDNEVKKDQNDKAPTTLCINEVCGVVDYKGIELYNHGDKAVSLEGWTIVKNDETTPCWTGTSGEVAAKGFQIIYGKKECKNLEGAREDGKGGPEAFTSSASFSPTKSLKLELKDPDGNVVSTFDRGWASNGNAEVTLDTVEYSYGLTVDGGTEWKLLDITIGKTNKGAADHGAIPTTVATTTV